MPAPPCAPDASTRNAVTPAGTVKLTVAFVKVNVRGNAAVLLDELDELLLLELELLLELLELDEELLLLELDDEELLLELLELELELELEDDELFEDDDELLLELELEDELLDDELLDELLELLEVYVNVPATRGAPALFWMTTLWGPAA